MSQVEDEINAVRRRIADSAEKSGRNPAEIRLICVSKKIEWERIAPVLDAGVLDLGESRVQEARLKFDLAPKSVRWHMIGPLQSNKAKYCPGLFTLVHSLDRFELIEELDKQAGKRNLVIDGLLQINISGEKQKSGCPKESALKILKSAYRCKNVSIKGLMTIPPATEDPEFSRPYFRELIDLKVMLEKEGLEHVTFRYISAGMSRDFEIAIEEGANMVRVGSAIFGKRE